MFCVVCGNTSDDGDGWVETPDGWLCYNCKDNVDDGETPEDLAHEAMKGRCKKCGCQHKKRHPHA